MNTTTNGKSRRGFASMDPQRQREIASMGGVTAHREGRAHQWTSAEAAEAGRKGAESKKQRRAQLKGAA